MYMLSWTSDIVQLFRDIVCFEGPVYLVCKGGQFTALSGSCKAFLVWENRVLHVFLLLDVL